MTTIRQAIAFDDCPVPRALILNVTSPSWLGQLRVLGLHYLIVEEEPVTVNYHIALSNIRGGTARDINYNTHMCARHWHIQNNTV
jgi:hypothetical protein